MDRRTQNAKILAYFELNSSATARELMLHCNVNSPRKRISELRQGGYMIVDSWVEKEDEYGETVRYKRYFYHGKKA